MDNAPVYISWSFTNIVTIGLIALLGLVGLGMIAKAAGKRGEK